MGITIGVDIGKGHHVAAAFDAAAGRALGQLRFPVSRAGFERFLGWVRERAARPDAALIGVEATGHYHVTLLEFLAGAGYQVVQLNAYQVTQFRRSQGRLAKTDRLDAQALARFLTLAARETVPPPADAAGAPPTEATLASLRELTRFRAELVRDRTAVINRLHGVVDLAFPELPAVLGRLTSQTALALLQAYPTAAVVAAADPDELTALLRTASRGQMAAKAAALIAAATTSIAARNATAALAVKAQALARQVVALNAEIAALEQTIATEFAALGYAPAHFPAGSVVALATLLSEVGDVRRFRSAKQFLAHFGWCPRDTQSGMYKDMHPRLSKAGNRYVRRLIWMLAVGVISRPGPFRDYFAGRTAAGKNKMDSLVAVGRKLLTTIYAILKTGEPYDPNFATRARALGAAVPTSP
jgi:transposase